MNIRRTVFAAMAIVMGSTLAMAQGHPPRIDIAALLDVDAAKAAQVQSILEASREKMHEAMESIRKDTDTKLAAVLTPDQAAKLKAAMPRPPGPGHARGNPQ